ncbi:MAG: DNA polymerase III subunit beta [Candidatus Latescibacteria bacterium]|nr:DNA polymerase III subunit beta [Candidatus Latescibacterota bacterium]
MKVVIEKNKLFEGLQRVFSVVPQKPTLPVLANFLINLSSGRMIISGTDMDMSITTSLDCMVEEEGSVTINAKRFLNIIRELPEGEITLNIENEKVTVEFKQGNSKIMGMLSTDFPPVKDSIDGVSVVLTGENLFEMVDKTSFSVATERTRVSLTGVYWRISSDNMIMVATDGHRLSLLERKVNVAADSVSEAIVPPKALNQASRIFSSEEKMKLEKVVIGRGMILFDFGTTTVFSKLIEGPYPDFRQVIPDQSSKKVIISNEELSAAIRRALVLSDIRTHQVHFSLSQDKLEINTRNADIGGEAQESLSVQYSGDPLTVSLNASFLLEILRKVETKEILIELETPASACIIKPVVKEEKGEHLYLIMPLRLNE